MANEVFLTSDAGATYTFKSLPGITGTFVPKAIFWGATDAEFYIVGTDNGVASVWRTTDTGESFVEQAAAAINGVVDAIRLATGDIVALLGNGSFAGEGPFRISSDHGAVWTTVTMDEVFGVTPANVYPVELYVVPGHPGVLALIQIIIPGAYRVEVWATNDFPGMASALGGSGTTRRRRR